MRIFYDCEFIEDGRTIDPISIGMVRDDGAEYYAVNSDGNPKVPQQADGEHNALADARHNRVIAWFLAGTGAAL